VDGPGDAIELAGAAFHADLRADQYRQTAIHLKGRMRANLCTHTAAIAQGRFVNKRIFKVGIQHLQSPFRTFSKIEQEFAF